MTALSADFTRRMYSDPMYEQRLAVKTSTTIYDRSAVCLEAADGFTRPVAASLTNPEFQGFALEGAANTGASGAVKVLVSQKGRLVVALAGVTGGAGVADIGSTVYLADDGTGLTLTSTNNVPIGKISAYVDSEFTIAYEADALRSI